MPRRLQVVPEAVSEGAHQAEGIVSINAATKVTRAPTQSTNNRRHDASAQTLAQLETTRRAKVSSQLGAPVRADSRRFMNLIVATRLAAERARTRSQSEERVETTVTVN